MERLLAIWVEELAVEAPDGSTLRDHLALLDALSVLCPFTESIRTDLLVLPLRGPSRFFGGEDAVFDAVGHSVRDVTGYEGVLGVGDGLFCAEMAARRALVLAPGTSAAFLGAFPNPATTPWTPISTTSTAPSALPVSVSSAGSRRTSSSHPMPRC